MKQKILTSCDDGKRWMADRYFRAYRERARQLGVTVGVAPTGLTP